MGWGIQYNPLYRDTDDFDDRAQQLVLCYVTIDVTIVYAKMMMQPEGGWYPAVMLHPYGKINNFHFYSPSEEAHKPFSKNMANCLNHLATEPLCYIVPHSSVNTVVFETWFNKQVIKQFIT